jgi:GNAT superfamily N-acetyltransferase
MEFQIRRATVRDALEIANLLRDIGFFAYILAETAQATEDRVTRHLRLCTTDDSHTIYVAENDQGSLLGYGAVHWLPYLILAGPEGYVSELFVAASARGLGIGGLLLRAIQSEAQQRGCARLMLLNRRSRESYQRQFYLKQGWEERGEMANFVYNLPDAKP